MSNNKELKEHHEIVLEYYLKIQKMNNFYKSSGNINESANLVFEAFNSNSLENKHAELELEAQSITNELRKLNTNIFEDKEKMTDFLLFIGNQLTRTRVFKDSFLNSFSKRTEKQTTQLIDDCWWFLSLMFGFNIGEKLCNDMENYQHTILVNETSIPFITADQPIVNIHPNLCPNRPPRDYETDYFYPLSPTRAYLISKSGRFTDKICMVDEDFVMQVNANIAQAAYFHIISSDKESLRPYEQLVGKKMVAG